MVIKSTFCTFCGEPINACTAFAVCDKCAEMSNNEMLNFMEVQNVLRKFIIDEEKT